MNYFEHHIGDYAESTMHLTFVEDAAYHRLMRKYYAKEMPIPAALKDAQRIVGARTKEEREAVKSVLEEFFFLEEDGWHQKKCDEVIEKYLSGEPEREVKKANEDNRLKRHREERAKLFKIITDAGEHASWNIGTKELRDLANLIQNGPPDTATETKPATPPDTAPATPATATQYPLPTTHTPVVKEAKASTSAAKLPTCQTQDVIDLYHEILPSLPKVRLHTKDRVKAIRKVWDWVLSSRKADQSRRAENAEEALNWFRDYFERATHNDFLMGRTQRGSEHANWQCDLDFLLTDRGMKQVIEKTKEHA